MCASCKRTGMRWGRLLREILCVYVKPTVVHVFCSHDGKGGSGLRFDASRDSQSNAVIHRQRRIEQCMERGGGPRAWGVKKCKKGAEKGAESREQPLVQGAMHKGWNGSRRCSTWSPRGKDLAWMSRLAPKKHQILKIIAWNKHLDHLFPRKTLQWGSFPLLCLP